MNRGSLLLNGVSGDGRRLWQKAREQVTSAGTAKIDFYVFSDDALLLVMGGHRSFIVGNRGGVNVMMQY